MIRPGIFLFVHRQPASSRGLLREHGADGVQKLGIGSHPAYWTGMGACFFRT
jgi:hypothetical protein